MREESQQTFRSPRLSVIKDKFENCQGDSAIDNLDTETKDIIVPQSMFVNKNDVIRPKQKKNKSMVVGLKPRSENSVRLESPSLRKRKTFFHARPPPTNNNSLNTT